MSVIDGVTQGWNSMYEEIVEAFGYDRRADARAAAILDSMIPDDGGRAEERLRRLVEGRAVFVIGAGPSLGEALYHLDARHATKIAADSAVTALLDAGMVPDVVVTDLDGDMSSLRRSADAGAVLVVHAHGDNEEMLHHAGRLGDVIGTSQGTGAGRVRDLGGFTDGDRAVFLAHRYGASAVVLFGMDFGPGVGPYSHTRPEDETTKIRKLEFGRRLLELLAGQMSAKRFTTSAPIRGFQSIEYGHLGGVLDRRDAAD